MWNVLVAICGICTASRHDLIKGLTFAKLIFNKYNEWPHRQVSFLTINHCICVLDWAAFECDPCFCTQFCLHRCSGNACIKAVLCMMFLLLRYHTMRSDEQVSVIGRLWFTARDHKVNLIWFFIIRDVVAHKTEGECVQGRRNEMNKTQILTITDLLFKHFTVEYLAINIFFLQ